MSVPVRSNGPFQSSLSRASGVIGTTCRPSDPATRDPRSSLVSSSTHMSRPRQLPGTLLLYAPACFMNDLQSHTATPTQLPPAPADTLPRVCVAGSGAILGRTNENGRTGLARRVTEASLAISLTRSDSSLARFKGMHFIHLSDSDFCTLSRLSRWLLVGQPISTGPR